MGKDERDGMREKDIDPRGLIREAFRIEGITAGECRSIFLDWALSLPMGADVPTYIKAAMALYDAPEAHPMTQTLKAGLDQAPQARRRGGRRARLDSDS